tara:strand:+ start:5328 stop:6995 length:1668 start_codon:yes stop_codon:yes gene_type:complete
MAKLLKLRRGNTSQHGSFTGAEGEVTVDTDKDTLVVHDGSTQSGFPLLRAEGGAQNISTSGTLASGNQTVTGNITVSGTVDGVDVAQLKTDFDAGADNINEGDSKVEVVDAGTGYVTTVVDGTEQIRTIPNQTTIKTLRVGENWTMADGTGNGLFLNTSNNNDSITGTASNGLEIRSASIELKQAGSPNNHYAVFSNNGCDLRVANAQKLVVNSSGTAITGNLDVSSGVDVTGDITVTGTVDGVDVAALNTTVGNLGVSGGAIASSTTATTQSQGDNSTKVATTAYTDTAVSNLVDSSPGALNTLNELAAAINDDASFSTTVTNNIATKMPLAGGEFTGNITCENITPDGDSSRNLGANSTRFANVYADNLYGGGTNITGIPAANLTGTAAAINGSNITNLSAANLTGTLPAIDGSNLTGITSFVSGMIIMYNSATAPSGWYLCDGNNGTPDLRDRFIVGAGNAYSQGATGGSNTATDTVSISGSDTVNISISGTTSTQDANRTFGFAQSGSHTTPSHSHTFSGSDSDTVNISGSDTVSIDTRSPYYALTFIMKA